MAKKRIEETIKEKERRRMREIKFRAWDTRKEKMTYVRKHKEE